MLLTHDSLLLLLLPRSCHCSGKSTWRVSSTLFGHIQSDQVLQPLEHFSTASSRQAYPPVLTGDQVQNELKMIKLAAK